MHSAATGYYYLYLLAAMLPEDIKNGNIFEMYDFFFHWLTFNIDFVLNMFQLLH